MTGAKQFARGPIAEGESFFQQRLAEARDCKRTQGQRWGKRQEFPSIDLLEFSFIHPIDLQQISRLRLAHGIRSIREGYRISTDIWVFADPFSPPTRVEGSL